MMEKKEKKNHRKGFPLAPPTGFLYLSSPFTKYTIWINQVD